MNEFNEKIASEKLALVDFFGTWCAPCRSMHPIIEQLKNEMQENIVILKVDIDKNPVLSDSFEIHSIPTLMLFRNGKPFWRQSGAISLNQLRAVIQGYQHV